MPILNRVKENISVYKTAAADADVSNTGKKLIIKNCAPSTDCINKVNNNQVDIAEDIAVVMPMYNFERTLEMPLINCEVNLILIWSADCIIIYTDVVNQIPTFTITEINLPVPVVT